jgi:hypothetical protein
VKETVQVAGTSPETDLLLACARVTLDAGGVERIRALVRCELDWTRIQRLAWAHGVLPLVYWHLSRVAPEAVPGAVLEGLRESFLANARNNLLLTAELLKVLKLFGAHGVRAVPFKGPPLAAAAYGNLALRQFGDLDLLVHPQDLPRAKESLLAQGYRCQLTLAPAQQAAYLASIGQLPFLSADGACLVELHARLFPRDFHFPLDWAHLSGRLGAVPLGGGEIPALSTEDLLLVVCAHGAKHVWACLGWICDVAELLRSHPAMDWKRVMKLAGKLRSKRMLLLGLYLSSRLLGAILPEGLRQAAHEHCIARDLGAHVLQRLFREGAGGPGGWQNALFHFRVRESRIDGARYSLSLALAPTVADWAVVTVPSSLSHYYYLLRLVRLIRKYAKFSSPRARGTAD